MASKCIPKLDQSQPPSRSLSYKISAIKCISKLAWWRRPGASLSSPRSQLEATSPNSLDCSFQVHLPVHNIMASKCISKFSQSAFPGAATITLHYCLPPDWRYVYIERDLDRQYMPYYEEANRVTLTKTNLIHQMRSGHGTIKTSAIRIWHKVSRRAAQKSQAALEVSADLEVLAAPKLDYPISQIL